MVSILPNLLRLNTLTVNSGRHFIFDIIVNVWYIFNTMNKLVNLKTHVSCIMLFPAWRKYAREGAF